MNGRFDELARAVAHAPPQRGASFLRGYAICGEQRSGSSYLCQLLRSAHLPS